MTTRPIGIVGVAFADITLDEMATRAAGLGFDHLDAFLRDARRRISAGY